MKYIKLFEEDDWWRKGSKFDNLVYKDWKLIKMSGDDGLYYIQIEEVEDKIKLYDTNRLYDKKYFDLDPIVDKHSLVGFFGTLVNFKSGMEYWELPKEIKNRLQNGI